MLSHHLKICTRPGLAAAAAAFALTLLVPTDGTAQQERTRRVILTDLPMAAQVEIASLAETTGKEADKFRGQAVKANQAKKYLKAGELFERSALLRTPGDERGMKTFEAAGTAYFNADKPKRASRAWEEAGNRALIHGNVYAASENYMRAALGAHETNNRVRVSDMAWKAYYLTESPQLTKAQRTKLRQRITVSPVTVAEAEVEDRTVARKMTLISMSMISSAEVERLQNVDARYRALRDSLAGEMAITARTPSAAERTMMTETIHFGHDRSDLSPEARAILRTKVPVFRAHPSMRIMVTGYASPQGTRAYNTALGLRRAEAARDYLVSQGVEKSRIDIATRGKDELAVTGPPSKAADAANRRGEFTILLAVRKISQN